MIKKKQKTFNTLDDVRDQIFEMRPHPARAHLKITFAVKLSIQPKYPKL